MGGNLVGSVCGSRPWNDQSEFGRHHKHIQRGGATGRETGWAVWGKQGGGIAISVQDGLERPVLNVPVAPNDERDAPSNGMANHKVNELQVASAFTIPRVSVDRVDSD